MGSFSIWHWLIVLVVVLVLFGGGGKLTKLMGDAGKGITAFKKGLKDQDKSKDEGGEDESEAAAQRSITDDSVSESASKERDKKASAG